jgi:hypothetical protein
MPPHVFLDLLRSFNQGFTMVLNEAVCTAESPFCLATAAYAATFGNSPTAGRTNVLVPQLKQILSFGISHQNRTVSELYLVRYSKSISRTLTQNGLRSEARPEVRIRRGARESVGISTRGERGWKQKIFLDVTDCAPRHSILATVALDATYGAKY